ncbi:ATP-binding protein [uncultured Pseudokineococcus sp.]|uniref:ATP-binding protein n=1 Tax=uncultured Pseudokineococcus sp. TaxID=1642928 RepID=UPI00260BED33|nr:ATP-binding protein [uncultured Pseudokineococcus sp.]
MPTQRQPALTMTGHLQWTRHGQVWATWRLRASSYGMRPVREKKTVRDLHRALLRGLDGQALLLGVVALTDPTEVVERMIEGVDLDSCPQWVEEAEATLDRLSELPMGARTFWLSVPLANTGRDRLLAPGAAAVNATRETLALPMARPSAAQIEARMAQAAVLQAAIPTTFAPTPASVAEQVWLAAHAQRRGLMDLPVPTSGSPAADELVTRSGAALAEPLLDEGGQGEGRRGDLRRVNPLSQRFLKVSDPAAADVLDQPPSYQALMVLGDLPAGGIVFPGAEYLQQLDRVEVDVDWAVRLQVHNRDKVLARTRKAVKNLNDQYDQQDGATSTGHHSLDLAKELLAEYEASFAHDRMEIEVEHTTIMAVGGITAAEAEGAAKTVCKAMAQFDIRLDRPVGAMTDLWWQMQPGVATSRLTGQLAQITTSSHYAMVCPVTTSRLGDAAGIPIAQTRATNRPQIVLHEIDRHTQGNVGASVAIAGETGAGKTYFLLSLCGAVADRGGQFLSIDRSSEAEYARLAAELDDHTVVDMADPAYSMDPLRLIADPGRAAQAAETFLLPLTGIRAQSPEGDTLSEVLSAEYRARHHLEGLLDVVEHLNSPACELPDAGTLASRLRSFARRGLGKVVFDRSLPPMPMTSQATVWLTRGLDLPTTEELSQQHLFNGLSMEKLFGRAYYALIAGLAREIARVDRSRLTLLTCDETHQINSSPESQLAVTLFIREGRRTNAGVGLGSHAPEQDFGDEVQRGLIRTRVAVRQPDRALAEQTLRWLGLDPREEAFEHHVETLMLDTSPLDPATNKVRPERRGEGFMKDVHSGIEPVRILGPALARRRRAMDTTPGAHAQLPTARRPVDVDVPATSPAPGETPTTTPEVPAPTGEPAPAAATSPTRTRTRTTPAAKPAAARTAKTTAKTTASGAAHRSTAKTSAKAAAPGTAATPPRARRTATSPEQATPAPTDEPDAAPTVARPRRSRATATS